MKHLHHHSLIVAVFLGLTLPGMTGAAEPGRSDRSRRSHLVVRDVSLDASGALVGQLVDAQGRPLGGESVVVHQGRKQIVRTVTNGRGLFQVSNLRGGLYQISSTRGAGLFRVWQAGTAPKKATRLALIVQNHGVVRGQMLEGLGLGSIESTLALGTSVAGVAVTTVVVTDKVNDDERPMSSL